MVTLQQVRDAVDAILKRGERLTFISVRKEVGSASSRVRDFCLTVETERGIKIIHNTDKSTLVRAVTFAKECLEKGNQEVTTEAIRRLINSPATDATIRRILDGKAHFTLEQVRDAVNTLHASGKLATLWRVSVTLGSSCVKINEHLRTISNEIGIELEAIRQSPIAAVAFASNTLKTRGEIIAPAAVFTLLKNNPENTITILDIYRIMGEHRSPQKEAGGGTVRPGSEGITHELVHDAVMALHRSRVSATPHQVRMLLGGYKDYETIRRVLAEVLEQIDGGAPVALPKQQEPERPQPNFRRAYCSHTPGGIDVTSMTEDELWSLATLVSDELKTRRK